LAYFGFIHGASGLEICLNRVWHGNLSLEITAISKTFLSQQGNKVCICCLSKINGNRICSVYSQLQLFFFHLDISVSCP